MRSNCIRIELTYDVMKNEILDLAKQFIKIKSVSDNPKALDEVLGMALSQLDGFRIEKFQSNGFPSALVYNTKTRPKKFRVVLNGHLDVIPGKDHQYKPKIIGNKLYGAGSMDMKSSVACLIMAFKETAKKVDYPLALQLVTDEQAGGLYGTRHQIGKGVRGDFIIAGEATNLNIVHKAKGVLWLKISCTGKTSHSAYPWQGENAIVRMNEFLNQLKKKYPRPKKEVWKTTISVSKIETTNNVFNKIPDDCTAWLDIRYVPEDKGMILKQIKNILPKGCTLNINFEQEPLFVEKNNPILKKLQKTASDILKRNVLLYGANGTSDVTYYAEVGCSGVEFGPVGMTGNTEDEYVDIPSLDVYCQILKKFLLNIDKTY